MDKDKQWLIRVSKKYKWRLVEAKDGYEALGILLEVEPDVIDDEGQGWLDRSKWGEIRLVR